ncbi:MAG: TetR/AcrR family transcriptional regulator [Bacteroidota bacterium]
MKKSEKTRQLIIEKSAVLFNQKGYWGTSMDDIMRATGLSKGGIYGNFGKNSQDKKGVKEEIAVAAFRHAVEVVTEEIRRRTMVIDNPVDKLKAVVYFYKERVLMPPVEGGCPIMNTSIEADDNQEALQEEVNKALDIWEHVIARVLQKGKDKGLVRQDINEAHFATVFIGTLEGGILLARIRKSALPFNLMAEQLLSLIETLKPNG